MWKNDVESPFFGLFNRIIVEIRKKNYLFDGCIKKAMHKLSCFFISFWTTLFFSLLLSLSISRTTPRLANQIKMQIGFRRILNGPGDLCILHAGLSSKHFPTILWTCNVCLLLLFLFFRSLAGNFCCHGLMQFKQTSNRTFFSKWNFLLLLKSDVDYTHKVTVPKKEKHILCSNFAVIKRENR